VLPPRCRRRPVTATRAVAGAAALGTATAVSGSAVEVPARRVRKSVMSSGGRKCSRRYRAEQRGQPRRSDGCWRAMKMLKPTREATTYASALSRAAWVSHSNPAAISSCSSRSSTSCPMPSSYHSGLRGRESARSLFRAGSVRMSS